MIAWLLTVFVFFFRNNLCIEWVEWTQIDENIQKQFNRYIFVRLYMSEIIDKDHFRHVHRFARTLYAIQRL